MTVAAAGLFATAVAALLHVLKSIWIAKTIYPNEKALKVRWSKVVQERHRLRKTGRDRTYFGENALVIPGVHKLYRCEARQQDVNWTVREISLVDGMNLRASMSLAYTIIDLRKGLIRADNLEEALGRACRAKLTEYATERDHFQIGTAAKLARELTNLLADVFADHGVGNCTIGFDDFCFVEAPGVRAAEARRRYIDQTVAATAGTEHPWTRQEMLALLGQQVLLTGSMSAAQSDDKAHTNGHGSRSNGQPFIVAVQ
jgi:hypothetical protein